MELVLRLCQVHYVHLYTHQYCRYEFVYPFEFLTPASDIHRSNTEEPIDLLDHEQGLIRIEPQPLEVFHPAWLLRPQRAIARLYWSLLSNEEVSLSKSSLKQLFLTHDPHVTALC